jgi:PqqD family protein of HPr-rel-A system
MCSGALLTTLLPVIELPLVNPGQVPDSENGEVAPAVVDLDFVPSKTDKALELDMGDGLVIYDHGTGLVHHLNPTAGIIWHLSDGEATVGDLARDIAAEYGLEPVEVENEIAQLVGKFVGLGLIEAGTGSTQDRMLGHTNRGQQA